MSCTWTIISVYYNNLEKIVVQKSNCMKKHWKNIRFYN
jgi:hypothetical protein